MLVTEICILIIHTILSVPVSYQNRKALHKAVKDKETVQPWTTTLFPGFHLLQSLCLMLVLGAHETPFQQTNKQVTFQGHLSKHHIKIIIISLKIRNASTTTITRARIELIKFLHHAPLNQNVISMFHPKLATSVDQRHGMSSRTMEMVKGERLFFITQNIDLAREDMYTNANS
ncbi:hypothetical protein ACJX0J_018598, partial [Zea mays]